MSTRWTPEQVLAYAKRQDKAGSARLRSSKSERDSGSALDGASAREKEGAGRFEICFTVFSRFPSDWDNWFTKPVQDLLVHAGILAGDNWIQLEGRVRSRQVSTAEEERTEIEIVEHHENET